MIPGPTNVSTCRAYTGGMIFRCTPFTLLAALVVFVSASVADDNGVPAPIWSQNFDDADAPSRLVHHKLLDAAPDEGIDGSTALRAKYVGYDRGSQRITSQIPLPKTLTEATLVYDVKFDRDFQFVKGGKLHGLGPDAPITGGRPMRPAGWSARVVFTGNGGARTYTYCQNKNNQYGAVTDRERPIRFKAGRYYSISLHVKLNDPDRANGSVRLYVDGKGVDAFDDVRFRSVGGDATLIRKFLFSTFHGGHTPDRAPRDGDGNYTTVHAYFDNFAVYEGKHVRKRP